MIKKVFTVFRDELVAVLTAPLPWWLFPGEWWDRAMPRWERRRG